MVGMASLLLKIALGAAAIYALVTISAWALQRRLMYFPDTTRVPPSAEGLPDVAERLIPTPDGATIVAWYGRAAPGQPTLLYFHGNGGGLATRSERIRRYLVRGRGVLMMSYRGYSGGTGSPSERNNVADAGLAYDLLVREGVPPERIVVYGESLGSGVAVQLAARRKVGGVILDSPYTSIVELGVRSYPFLPVRWLMSDRYETLAHIGAVHAPLLIVHGEQDDIVPVDMSRALFAAASEPKLLVTYPDAGHSDHYMFGSYDTIHGWLDRLGAAVR